MQGHVLLFGILVILPAAILSACRNIDPSLSKEAKLPGDPVKKDPPPEHADEPGFTRLADARLLSFFADKQAEEQDLYSLSLSEAVKTIERMEKQKIEEKPREEPPTSLQDAPGPQADDQLLGLWKAEIDRAMTQPQGRRKIQFSLPTVENNRVRYFLNFFRGRKRNFFELALGRSGKYIPMMATILQEEGLPEDLVYLSLIESGFSPHAVSRAKAVGPWQFIRGTGIRYGLKINWWVDERRDPLKSTRAAARYLKDLHSQFGEWFLSAAAYNAGERKVEKAVNRSKTNDFWRLSQKKYLKTETRNYVPKFIAATLIASEPDKYGFADIAYQPPVEYDEVRINMSLKLKTIASLAHTTANIIKELNPSLLRDHTPPDNKGFMIRLPAGSGEIFAKGYQELPDSAQFKMITHKIRKGETLKSIAKRYHQQMSHLMEMNGLRTQQVRVGQELIVGGG